MIESEQPYRWSGVPARAPDFPIVDDWREQTVPGLLPLPLAPYEPPVRYEPPAILGFPAEEVEDDEVPLADGLSRPRRRVGRRHGDGLAGVLLLLAGLAGGASLVLHWVPGERAIGLAGVQRGLRALGAGFDELGRGTLWQPVAVVLGGGVLFLLGVLLFVPARTHRLLGVLALVVTGAAAIGVLVPLADAGWRPERFDIGMWFAVSVAGLGLLGALKAMLTGPRVPTLPRLR